MCSALFQVLSMLTLVNIGVSIEDPCDSSSHVLFPQRNFGARNEKCQSNGESTCDMYFKSNWYIVKNATALNHCPKLGYCGVTYPAWVKGTFPTLEDGIVNRTACIKFGNICCNESKTIQMKNCTTFLVYYFVPLTSCPMAYCFESDLPCEPPTTTPVPGVSGVSKTTTLQSTDGNKDRFTTTANVSGHTGKILPERKTNSKDIVIGVSVGLVGLLLIVGIVIIVVMVMTGKFKANRSAPSLSVKQHQAEHIHEYINSPIPYHLPQKKLEMGI
ncbi:uncharacterized protein LOC132713670 [Ruditapes philippinarum]|uniref:uncharacterized protein LOC132713670 n=1 Tax=Ruditapes philippinarum TaxID=129788 RepID=UPI00295B0339|nr:uncharacterized protein LOC132713670 [Ruditapes philippinarum]